MINTVKLTKGILKYLPHFILGLNGLVFFYFVFTEFRTVLAVFVALLSTVGLFMFIVYMWRSDYGPYLLSIFFTSIIFILNVIMLQSVFLYVSDGAGVDESGYAWYDFNKNNRYVTDQVREIITNKADSAYQELYTIPKTKFIQRAEQIVGPDAIVSLTKNNNTLKDLPDGAISRLKKEFAKQVSYDVFLDSLSTFHFNTFDNDEHDNIVESRKDKIKAEYYQKEGYFPHMYQEDDMIFGFWLIFLMEFVILGLIAVSIVADS